MLGMRGFFPRFLRLAFRTDDDMGGGDLIGEESPVGDQEPTQRDNRCQENRKQKEAEKAQVPAVSDDADEKTKDKVENDQHGHHPNQRAYCDGTWLE